MGSVIGDTSLFELLAGGGLMSLVGLLTWVTTSRSTARQGKADALAKAADAYGALTDDLRLEVERMRGDIRDMRVKISELNETNSELALANQRLLMVMSSVVDWLKEWAEWEAVGGVESGRPQPYSASVLLDSVENALKGVDDSE